MGSEAAGEAENVAGVAGRQSPTSRTRLAGTTGDRSRHRGPTRDSPQAIDNTLYDAFGQRQVSTMYKPLNQYHVVMEVDPQLPGEPRCA